MMLGILLRSTGRSVVAILCAASLLAASPGSVSRAVADDTWETWPRKATTPEMVQEPATGANGAAGDWETWPGKKAVPDMERKPATDGNEADKPGDAAVKKPTTGRSYGTIGWIALGIAAVIGISLAAGGGGGGDGGGVVTNPGHQ
ncbi:MAG: hypothetical protein C4529_10530 [Deltaproteobacteria bacterium]|nr:MAG: hypothetical protein C4529_10530 [Deltaproteobacteria bacterium]